jgi:hypothetical protein
MNPLLLGAISNQFGAAMSMLEQQIVACPDALWADGSKPEAWHIAYHSLFYVDLYCSGSIEAFEAPVIHLPDAQDLGIDPREGDAAAPSKAEILQYSGVARARARAALGNATTPWLASRAAFPWIPSNNLELLLYTLRHVQHHTRALSVLVRGVVGESTPWVASAPL